MALSDTPDKDGLWYEHLCKSTSRTFGGGSQTEKRIANLTSQYDDVRNKLRLKEDELAKLEMQGGRRGREYHKMEGEVMRLKRKADKLEQLSKGTAIKREIYFSGLDVTPDDIRVTANAWALITFILLFAVFIYLYIINAIQFPYIDFLLIGVIFVPLIIYVYLSNYITNLGNRLRIQTLGRAPEAVHYMVMSMRLTPALDKAVKFASDNVGEPLASSLKKVLWDVSTRAHSSIEDSFMAFAEEWGNWNDDFKRSMYSIRMATHEKTEDGLAKNLEKALDTILNGTRRKIEEFATSLQTPTTVLFGLGILLPMIIGAMLPLLMLSNATNLLSSNPLGGAGGVSSGTGPFGTSANLSTGEALAINIGLIVLMDVMFPLIAYAYSSQILGQRPGTLKPPAAPEVEEFSKGFLAVISVAVGVAVSSLAFPIAIGAFGGFLQPLYELFPIFGIACGLSVYFYLGTVARVRARRSLQQLEAEFPDALYQVGSRMVEGLSLEQALERTADAMTGSQTSVLFRKILHGMRVSGRTANEVIFGSQETPGVMAAYPSHMVEMSMKELLEAVTKGAEAVGRTIVPTAQYLRELRQVDDTIRTSLKSTVSMMTGTAIAFAPLVMGMTGALYILLTGVFQAGLPVSIPVFFSVMGVYLLEIVIVITYFSVGVEQGGDETTFQSNLGFSLVIAAAVFVAAAILGLYFVAGAV